MHYGLFRKKLSIKNGKELLDDYCAVNGFDDNTKQWKKPSHSKHLFSYHKCKNRMVANNWVSYHQTRGGQKYTVWIDLVSKDIIEILRNRA